MPLLDRVLASMRLRASMEVAAACCVCGRPASDREERVRLNGGAHVHRTCATYRMRRAHREERVAAVRSGLRPPVGVD